MREFFLSKLLLVVIGLVFLQWINVAQAASVEQAFAKHKSDIQVEGLGRVSFLLKDDNKGSRHQKFILKLPSGQTILVVHNIDLAQRINNISTGDIVQFYGEYEWNAKGGLVHWTHRDPRGRHIDGWLKHNGKIYQ